ncbi:MAG TPA: polysaccharide deacetylase family protein [Candidatus Binatia bacterium]|nr:polysaccharide deacetylase family protein [Candidatus Binatia bacterium]
MKATFVPGAIILLYHRVTKLAFDPQLLSVRPPHFEEHLEILRREFHPMGLGAFLRALVAGKVPERTVVVTMDDGYADMLHEAKPLLERFDLPATVFVTAGYVGSRREFWWDDLEKAFFCPEMLPERLCLSINGDRLEYHLGNSAQYGRDRFDQDLRWHVEMDADPSERHAIYRSLVRLLRPLADSVRRNVLDQLLSWADADIEARSTHRALHADELLCLVSGELIDVGAHTVTHPVLATLSEREQRIEIEESKRMLENMLGSQVSHFAYPFGSPADFTHKTGALVQEAGFSSGCANYPGIVWNARNRFQWPRMLVRDWDGEEFGRRLREWCGA